MTSQVYVWPWRLSWTAVNLLTLHTFNKSCYLMGTSLFHFLMCEWNNNHDKMLLGTGVSWRYKKFEIQSTRQTDSIENSSCTTSDCWHNSRLCTVHYTCRTLQGVLITSLSLSDRVSCSDRLQDMGFRPQYRHAIFLFSSMSRQAVGPPNLLFKGYVDYSLRVKWPGCGVDHSPPYSGQD